MDALTPATRRVVSRALADEARAARGHNVDAAVKRLHKAQRTCRAAFHLGDAGFSAFAVQELQAAEAALWAVARRAAQKVIRQRARAVVTCQTSSRPVRAARRRRVSRRTRATSSASDPSSDPPHSPTARVDARAVAA